MSVYLKQSRARKYNAKQAMNTLKRLPSGTKASDEFIKIFENLSGVNKEDIKLIH